MRHIIYGITGGSGAPLALRLLKYLARVPGLRISLLMSPYARDVFRAESNRDWGKTFEDLKRSVREYLPGNDNVECVDEKNMGAKISSGSNPTEGMIIAPCSMSTLASIASGVTMNLIHRTASVMLKEKRNLILVPRESPLNPIHLKNMLELCRLGVHIVPPTMIFYNQAKNIDDMMDAVCMKVLDLAGLPHDINARWKGERESSHESDSRIHRYME